MTIHFSKQSLLQDATDFATRNHRVISQNMANVNTPNYRTRQMSFDQFVEQATSKRKSSTDPIRLDVEISDDLVTRADGNGVDLDAEVAKLKRNELYHQTLTQLMGSKIETMRNAMRR